MECVQLLERWDRRPVFIMVHLPALWELYSILAHCGSERSGQKAGAARLKARVERSAVDEALSDGLVLVHEQIELAENALLRCGAMAARRRCGEAAVHQCGSQALEGAEDAGRLFVVLACVGCGCIG